MYMYVYMYIYIYIHNHIFIRYFTLPEFVGCLEISGIPTRTCRCTPFSDHDKPILCFEVNLVDIHIIHDREKGIPKHISIYL